MITGTSKTIDERRYVIDLRHLSLHNDGHVQRQCPSKTAQLWENVCLLHVCTRKLQDLHDPRRPPCQCTATGESLWETKGICICATTGMTTSSTVLTQTARRNCTTCKQGHRQPYPHSTGETLWSDRTVGICLCAVKEMSKGYTVQLSFWSLPAKMQASGPENKRREHGAKCIVTSKTPYHVTVHLPAGLPTTK